MSILKKLSSVVSETLIHIAPYAGFPATWEALAMADGVLGEEWAPNSEL